MFDKERNPNSFIAGVITGGVIGSITALLLAPKSGKDLRKDISDKKDELIDETNHLIENAKERASSIIFDATKKAEKLIDDGRKKVESMTKDAEGILNMGKDKFESISKGAGDFINHSTDQVNEGMSKVKDVVKSGLDSFTESGKLKEGSKNYSEHKSHEDKNKIKNSGR